MTQDGTLNFCFLFIPDPSHSKSNWSWKINDIESETLGYRWHSKKECSSLRASDFFWNYTTELELVYRKSVYFHSAARTGAKDNIYVFVGRRNIVHDLIPYCAIIDKAGFANATHEVQEVCECDTPLFALPPFGGLTPRRPSKS